jgi:hypothetical protein
MWTQRSRRASSSRKRNAALLRVAGGCGIAIWGAVAWTGCLLDTREPEGRDNDPGIDWITPETMGDGLKNMENALEAKKLTNYGRSFSEFGLEMTLDPAHESELGGNPFADWTKEQEEQRMNGILNSARAAAATLTVQWALSDSVDEGSSNRYYEDLGYRLTFTKGDSVADYSGKVQLWFEDDGTGQWYVFRWIDKRDASGRRSWGWLRASNRIEFHKR